MLERFQLLAVVSLPQTAFSHYGAGVKASLVFLRKRPKDEKPNDEEVIFMAAPENIGYDATGRKTFVRVSDRIEKGMNVETVRCDFFDAEITTDKNTGQEIHRRILPDSGILGQYRAFCKNPKPFFV